MIVEAVKWIGGVDGYLEIIDQCKLPVEFVKLKCTNTTEVYNAIKTLSVRGAPAIGVAAAYGLVLGLGKLSSNADIKAGLDCLLEAKEYLGKCRPTAVNLSWALERMLKKAEALAVENPGADLVRLREVVLSEANTICAEDVEMCRKMGENGERFIKDDMGILTHCNAGALATAGQGTALAVIFEAHKKGRKFKVYADETRPLLQGARLTAWELLQAGVDVTVICDNMAGWLMKQGKIDMVITGADRIAANGDAANKIGTYSLSILAKAHNIPFYIAAPSSSFDLSIKTGNEIQIEQRPAEEVRTFAGRQIAPEQVEVYNPAFDVTEASDIAAIITERGVIERPTAKKVAEHFK
ncbi:MAG: S-methyl-5-thioribose-1-phosphate isomerase [Planctomycetota bacterium]|jgi:methylthioribose-1-phosphate isomerase